MRLLMTVHTADGELGDVVLSTDATATVGDAAFALSGAPDGGGIHTLLLRTGETWDEVDPAVALVDSPVGSGATVAVGLAERTRQGSGQSVTVTAGPDAGRRVQLRVGLNTIGRDGDCDVALTDPMVSKRHAQILVQDEIEVIDDNSVNGLLSGGQLVQRATVRPGDEIQVGDTTLTFESTAATVVREQRSSGTIAFNRSPRVVPPYPGEQFDAPEPPAPIRTQPVPWATAAVPVLMGAVLYLATRHWEAVLFVALSPLMVVGSYFQNRSVARREYREAVEQFERDLAGMVVTLRQAQDRERAVRLLEHPSVADVVDSIRLRAPLMWTRRREHTAFLDLRLGLGQQACRTTVQRTGGSRAPWDLRQQVEASITPFEVIDNVPIACRLTESGALGISGPLSAREGVSAGILAQLVGLHSPADVCIAAAVSPSGARRWNWLKWLPHAMSEHHPLGLGSLADTAGTVNTLMSDLAALINQRSAEDEWTGAAIVLLVENDAPIVRSAVIDIAERGPAVGIYVVWCADDTADLPAVCRTFLELEPTTFGAATGKVSVGERVEPVVTESVDPVTVDWLGHQLAPVVDGSIFAGSESDIPSTVSLVAEVGIEVASSPEFIVDRWRESNSIRESDEILPRLRRDNSLRAMVGRTSLDPMYLDLRSQGPHALVGGTTGAGKSEFLQTWILAMAARHGPQRVTFLFVDYKGGAAFAECTSLPHSVGLVTDLSPRLVQRALRSLNAELRYREHILNRKRAKDLLELERRRDPEAPPSLVIVVDEFAALIQEVPEFVDGVVNVAQRGRSLGLHLILATQRPAGVIKGNLRANTNLRIALRMADADDSSDVVGIPDAAGFDPAVPGRGIARTGPGRMALFQSAYVGGVTESVVSAASIEVRSLPFSPGPVRESSEGDHSEDEADTSPDIHRVVATIREAHASLGHRDPRRPWLPELADRYDLASLPTPRTDAELVMGVRDEPDEQRQGVVAFRPDVDGNLLVFGTGGSGKSATLRTLAVAAGLTVRGGPCQVYGLDFGARGLSMLEILPHVGAIVDGDDVERVGRLLRSLVATIGERATRFSQVNAGSLSEFRDLAHSPDEPRIILLLDGYGAFRNAFEMGLNAWMMDAMQTVVADGRAVGVHVILSADRLAAVPGSLASGIQQRLVLRLAGENDLLMAGLPLDAFDTASPPGRGYIGDHEVQVAVLGGAPEATTQARALQKLAESMRRAGAADAPGVARLPELVLLDELPTVDPDGRPVLGILDETLGPLGFDADDVLLVTGPAKSGRTSAVATIVASLRRAGVPEPFAYLGWVRSPLATLPWGRRGIGPTECAELARELLQAIAEGRRPGAVVVDGIADFVNSDADMVLQDLVKSCRKEGIPVIVEGETSELMASWPLLQAVKSARHGIILQPEQSDGDSLLKTPFPRVRRTDFPVGRGIYVRRGRTFRVQVAVAVH